LLKNMDLMGYNYLLQYVPLRQYHHKFHLLRNVINNISGGFESRNIDVVHKIIKLYDNRLNPEDHIDYSVSRPGQDVRYSLDDSKLRKLGWMPKKLLFNELQSIVDNYRNKFNW